MVDTTDSKSVALRRAGSSPASGTTFWKSLFIRLLLQAGAFCVSSFDFSKREMRDPIPRDLS